MLVIVFVVAGALYTWVMGKNAKPDTSPPPVVSRPRTLPKPREPDPNAPVGVAIQTLSSPIKPGENAVLGIHTTPTASCVLTVAYNKVPAKDSGIVDKVADEYGIVSWSWALPPNTPPGKWPVDVTCSYGKHSGYVHGDIEVKP